MKLIFTLLLIGITFIGCKEANIGPNGELMYKLTDVAGAKKMIANNPNIVILDVRTPEEFSGGAIPNAIEIDVKNPNFDSKIEELDKSKQYLLYCRSGIRSGKASKKMYSAGFTDLTSMEGGYNAWK